MWKGVMVQSMDHFTGPAVAIGPKWAFWTNGSLVVPPFYYIRVSNGSFAAVGDALFTAKEARCFPATAFRFVCLPSARLSARRKRWRDHRDPGGVFTATRELLNGTQRCSGRKPFVPVMEPADLWNCHDLSAAGLN